jgi:hypothetical protein
LTVTVSAIGFLWDRWAFLVIGSTEVLPPASQVPKKPEAWFFMDFVAEW